MQQDPSRLFTRLAGDTRLTPTLPGLKAAAMNRHAAQGLVAESEGRLSG